MFADWWSNRSERDRRILKLALPAVLVLVALVLARPLVGARQEAERRLERTLEDIAWLQAQRHRIAAPVCEPGAGAAGLRELAKRYGIDVESGPGGRWLIREAPGNDALAFLLALGCGNTGLERFRLDTAAEGGRVSGWVEPARGGGV